MVIKSYFWVNYLTHHCCIIFHFIFKKYYYLVILESAHLLTLGNSKCVLSVVV